jgi:tetratricopeptide (TPR) repeat protein
MSVIAFAAVSASAGCASARIRKANALALAAADMRVLEGCYSCLIDARTTYARVAGDKHTKQPAPVVARLFETDVLLALREKELGLDSRASVDRARALAPRVAASLEAKRVLDMVDAVLPDGNAYPLKIVETLLRSHKPFTEKIDAELAWVEQAPLTPAVRKYIALAVDCSYPDRHKNLPDSVSPLAKRRELPINAPPLVAYRAANCAKTDTLALKRVINTVPAFDEAAYALGDVVVWFAGETGGEDAQRYFSQAHARFPNAPGITFMLGWLNLNIGDCAQSIRYYDTTLVMVPAHERALLQKTICQSRSHQDSAAIATVTRFIGLDTPDIAEGYYWRAVSQLRLRALDAARSDIEKAKARSRSGEILTVAGIIEHEQNDLMIAEADLRGARAAWKGSENCAAAFYLGSVMTKREIWSDAEASYDSASVCYDDKANLTAAMIDRVRNSAKGSATFRARRIAVLESDLADLRKRYFSSSFNTASMNARLGNFTRAEALLVIVDRSLDLADQVAKLREQLAAARQR